jgi:hypothetical protein
MKEEIYKSIFSENPVSAILVFKFKKGLNQSIASSKSLNELVQSKLNECKRTIFGHEISMKFYSGKNDWNVMLSKDHHFLPIKLKFLQEFFNDLNKDLKTTGSSIKGISFKLMSPIRLIPSSISSSLRDIPAKKDSWISTDELKVEKCA